MSDLNVESSSNPNPNSGESAVNAPILFTKDDFGVARIIFNRPEAQNAIDPTLAKQLLNILTLLEDDKKTRVVVISGSGEHFSSGVDLSFMRQMELYTVSESMQNANVMAHALNRLYSLPQATIALVKGKVSGGGVGLLSCCDIAIASSESIFSFSETKLGFIPAIVCPYILATIGERLVRRYFLTAEEFNAEEAKQWGLIHEIVPPSELEATAQIFVKKILGNAPIAVKEIKKLVLDIYKKPIDEAVIAKTENYFVDARSSADVKEGLNALLENREPNWSA